MVLSSTAFFEIGMMIGYYNEIKLKYIDFAE